MATRALEMYLQALESASQDAQSASRAPVSSLLSGNPKFTYFTSYRLTTELQYARDKLALSDIPPLPKHHPTDRQINAHRLLEHSKFEIDSKLSELANLRGDESDESDESATEVDDDTLMQMLRKAILVVDDLRRITDLFQVYRDALERKEKEKSERHKENLETLQTVSGAITGIVGAVNPR
jgi:hypothetical protein